MITIKTDKEMNVSMDIPKGTTHGEMLIGSALIIESLSFSTKKPIEEVIKSVTAIALDERKIREQGGEE